MRLVVRVRFADSHTEDVALEIGDPSMILNDPTGTAGPMLGALVLDDLVEAHGPIMGRPQPVRRGPPDGAFPNHNRLSSSMRLAALDARTSA